ncbi:MAG: Bax inhibitor-1/YccA family protein [Hyphomicrobiales bacterium]|nr:Bax inhibitor-1/YccA family protein [Hyphomicrobiales bacterium]MBV9051705.1 Bax inhibitor-1/YccA family protein [Hyphomicrobiales bacterium]MBV9590928.1 Bax inhibitor-1/YccA family protein [Hyphomicrobiales bacterium]MBV9752547.1 Bax inhibitor-1/YccA family protein [Hyphomicrobiales bacterium]MBV9975440.1 Bax inhibitor-1/YccA family protein [Hyphomicrobiales bacterium]
MSFFDGNARSPMSAGVSRVGTAQYDAGLRAYMLGIYNHMTLGLAISAFVAYGAYLLAASNPAVRMALYGSPLRWIIMLAPLGFVMFMSFRFDRMSYQSLLGTFWAFAAVMGLSLSAWFLIFKVGSIVQVFFVTAAAFGGLSLYGYTTRRSLAGVGAFMAMGLIGLIVAMLINIFVQSSAFQFALNIIGVVIFAGLTAWDTQRLKDSYDQVAYDSTLMAKYSLMGALTLYLNFINLFQFLLSIMGNRNN